MNKYPTYAEAEDVILYSYFDPQGLEIKSGLMTGIEWMDFLSELRRKNTPEDCLCATKIYHIEATLDEDGKAIIYESLEDSEIPHYCCNCEHYISDAENADGCRIEEDCASWQLRKIEGSDAQ